MKFLKKHALPRRVMALLLCACMVLSLCEGLRLVTPTAQAAGTMVPGTAGVTRQADPSTMDTYTKMLDFSTNTRYAGRLWSDKSVFALGYADKGDRNTLWDAKTGTLTLTTENDGLAREIGLDEDFLHVYSVLGSSMEFTGVPPVRTVIVFDNSGSMYNQTGWENTRIAKTVAAINNAIDMLMLSSQYNEVAVVLFGDGSNNRDDVKNTHCYNGHSTAVTIMPMKHYTPSTDAANDYKDGGIIAPGNNTQYLTAGWSNNQENADGEKPSHEDKDKGEGGWVFVNNDICKLSSNYTGTGDNPGHNWYKTEADGTWTGWNGCGTKTYTAYQNGTTNIQAGMYQGMQELLNANKTEQVGNQVYQCVPSLVMLTDGAVTDALNNWLTPDTADGILNKAMGFVCDFTYKGVSFVQHNDPRGGFSDWNNTAWNQFLAVKAETGKGTDPKGSSSDEAQNAKDGKIYYESVASADASDRMIHYVEDKWTPTAEGGEPTTERTVTKSTDESLTAMQALANQYRDNEAYMIFNYLLTTAYYKQAVKSAYNVSGTDDWSIYTITVDMPNPATPDFQAGFETNDATKAAITSNPAMMDPGEYFNEDWLKSAGYLTPNTEKNTYYDDYTVGDMTVEGIQKAIQAWKKWTSGEDVELETFRSIQSGWSFTDHGVKDKIKVYDDQGNPTNQEQNEDTFIDKNFTDKYPAPNHGSFWRVYAKQTIGTETGEGDFYIPTKTEAAKEAKKAGFQLGDLSYDYVTKAYYASTASDATQELAKTFEEIVDAITAPLFAPVGGANDLGVEDSVTYMDPVGKYMDVKDVKNLLLFGELYGIVKTAVYDYQWNHAYMEKTGNGKAPLKEGWYKGDPNNAQYQETTPVGKTSKDMWDDGWVYRLSYENASKFVPTLKTINNDEVTDPTQSAKLNKMRHTTYTFYRIDKDQTEREKLRMNPAYGTKVPSGVTYDTTGAGKHMEGNPGVYALSDLRIWVEDSGDYSDSLGDTLTDTNYDEALWVNIPVNMLPLRTVSIDLGNPENGTDNKWAYTTNLNDEDSGYKASFPLRVFYTVGVSDDVLGSAGQINMGAIDAEYVQANRVASNAAQAARGIEQGNVEFFSNWYNPLNRYGDYATTSTDYTYGDPVTSFSPSTDNRYYIFEKALPLYKAAYQYTSEGKWAQVSIDQTGETGTRPADFGGNLIAVLEGVTSAAEIAEKLGEKTLTEGDIVLLKSDILDDVTKKDDTDPFPSEGYFFLAIEYYALNSDNATWQQYVITRKGSEFGSAYKASGISNGDMLVWHDVSGQTAQDYPYLSFSETGDASRGRDYIGTPIDPTTGWYQDVPKGEAPKSRPTTPAGTWVVCAKPGGLRVGGLSQAVQAKGGDYSSTDAALQAQIDQYYGKERYEKDTEEKKLTWGFYSNNVTRTANNYYMPTISAASNAGENDIIVNVYLGNNGRLYVQDTTLMVSKLVQSMDGAPIDLTEQFNFQVTVAGLTGEQSAIVTRWNEKTNSWQRQFHYIDMELDPQLFLQTQDGQKAMVDSEGCRIVGSDGNYSYAEECKSPSGTTHSAGDEYKGTVNYVFMGTNRNSEETIGNTYATFRVYHNDEVDKNGTVDKQDATIVESDGKGTVRATTVWLVSATTYATEWEGEKLDPINDAGFDITKHSTKPIENFELLTINPNVSDETTDISITTPYRTISAYRTKEVVFGLDAEDLYDSAVPVGTLKTPEEIAAYTAEFTLRHGEGLLFTGIGSGANYRVTEKLTDAQMDKGYSLKQVVQQMQQGDPRTTAPGADTTGVFSVTGDTGVKEESANFINNFSNGKKETAINGDTGKPTGDGTGNQPGVQVGDTITYQVKWANTTGKTATVVIIDPLDVGVDWVSSEGGTYYATADDANKALATAYGEGLPTVTNDRVVVWVFKDSAPTAYGTVTLTVKVNENAKLYWDYGGETGAPDDYKVRNRATVYVGENSYYTNTVVNPVGEPDKTETNVHHAKDNSNVPVTENDNLTLGTDGKYHGPLVYVGDKITYEISWRNYEDVEALITIRDPLDKNVSFVSAKVDSTELIAPETTSGATVNLGTAEDPNNVPEIVYDAATHTVTWNLGKQAAGAYGTVTLTVEVLSTATPAGCVDNTAYVKVNGDPEQQTKTIENPTPETQKTETTPGDGELVKVGQVVTYSINWKSNTTLAEGETLENVTVTDKLDPGVDFVSASEGSTYDSATHTVTWTFTGDNVPTEGSVSMTVRVTARALVNDEDKFDDEDYRDNGGIETEGGQLVQNRASVKFDDDPDIFTNTVKNPVGPEKEEATPGDGEQVQVGDEIHYRIHWQNYQGTAAAVTIVDPLDPGVDFVRAVFNGMTLNAADGSDCHTEQTVTLPANGAGVSQNIPVIQYFNGKSSDHTPNHCVVWNLGVQPSLSEGWVDLYVKVNSNAVNYWQYGKDDTADTDDRDGDNKDHEVVDRASVQVGNDNKIYTDIVENPVPEKTETKVNNGPVTTTPKTGADNIVVGPVVKVGDEITYEISWKNGYDQSATVTITDPLDPGVDFVSADNSGVYNTATHTVTWTLSDRPACSEGKVTLVVKVNAKATPAGMVDNRATVTVGDSAKSTVTIENPTPELKKTEVTPGAGQLVKVGDTVNYEISWNNYQSGDAKVVVTDVLDPGVDFKSASFEGVKLDDKKSSTTGTATLDGTEVNVVISYDSDSHTITWTIENVPAGYAGKVSFFVVVNNKADELHNYNDKGVIYDNETAEKDYQILNQGGVKVGNDDTFYTEIIPNPTEPVKDEIQINDQTVTTTPTEDGTGKVGPEVAVGDVITYTVTWQNTESSNAVVTITDTLSDGLEYVDAGVVTVGSDGKIIYAPAEPGVLSHSGQTVTWTIEAKAGENGMVWVKAQVTADAKEKVVNNATVQVGHEPATDLTPVENPVTSALVVTKTVTGSGDKTKDFNFTVTLSDKSVTGQYGDMTFTNGVTAFTLKHGESATAVGLPGGTTYTVTEAEANQDGYSTSATGATGTIPHNGTAKAEFTNYKPTTPPPGNPTGSLTVKKTVAGVGDKNKAWTFTVTLSQPLNGPYGGMTFTGGVATFTLKDGESRSASGLPAGTGYTVTEAEANQDGYTTSSTGAAGSIPANSTAHAEFINNLPEGEPHKEEVTPGDGQSVKVGDTITYRITWQNDKSETATVTIRDPLDKGVDFVSASNGGVYDAENHKVTWTLPNQAAGASGEVTLLVKVNSNATKAGVVKNQAFVQVGNGPEKETEIPENPTGEPHKTEVTPGDGKYVNVGDSITYEITWQNYENEAATVTIRDPLDVGVDFVSADNGGVYDAATHTVTWTLPDRAAGANGAVRLVVKVNEKALEDDLKVVNQAFVKVGENPEQATEIPENPTGEPHKKEVTPGDGQYVKVGDEITYEITWQNYELEAATVTIRDPLDVGVDFVSADNGGVYDAVSHTVTWTLPDRAAGASGAVRLVVKVNEKALEDDMKVVNQAFVKVGSNPEQATEIPENPTDENPHKTEVTPGDGELVKVGDTITYKITWNNDRTETATVTIRDPLDVGVDFVSADNGGVYDAESHKVTWTLPDQAAGANGSVTLTVKVNEKATQQGVVKNQAFVKVDNSPEKETEIPENPTGEPHKTEETPGDGLYVGVGDEITYKITWQNYELETATVVIRDPLDVGVDFVSADNGGVYDAATRTVTWTLPEQAAGASGAVYLTVRVNARALEDDMKVVNQAFVRVGNNPEQATEIPENPTEQTGNLMVTKVVIGDDEGVDGKTFTFTVTGPDGYAATFTLKNGESVTLKDLKPGTYTVTEADATVEGYTLNVTGGGAVTVESGKTARATVTNTYTEPGEGNLTVTKTVSGNATSNLTGFHFTVTLSEPLNGPYGGMTFTNGVAGFTLRHGESVTASGLPAGITYTVTEAEANQDGYKTTDSGSTGTIPDGGTAVAAFLNSREVPTEEPKSGPLAVRKLVTGEEGDLNKEFHFRVTLSERLTGIYGDMTFVNGVAEFTLKSGEVMWGREIPVGTGFTVEELDANQDGYTTVAQGTTGEIMDAVRSEVRFQNHKGPWTPEDDEPWEELPDPEVPLDYLPKTGDESKLTMWLTLTAVSFLALVLTAYPLFSKKRFISRKGRHVKQ